MKKAIFGFLLSVLVLLSFLVFFGCGSQPDREVVIEDVVQINWHERNLYTFRIQKGDSPELDRVTVRFSEKPREIADVPPGKKCWVKYVSHWELGMGGPFAIRGEIHLHGVKDIQGGGWDHGKQGRGTTTVIE